MKRNFKRFLVASLAVGVMSFSPIFSSEKNLQIVSVAYAEKDSEILDSAEDSGLPKNETSDQIDNEVLAKQKLEEGNELYDQENYQDAISKYDEAIKLNPNYSGAYNNRGNAFKGLKNYDQAIKDFDEAIRLDSNNSIAYKNRGIVYAKMKKYDSAMADLDKAVQTETSDGEVYYYRGLCHKEFGENEKADADFAKAKELGYDG